MRNSKTSTITLAAMLVAIEIILSRFLSVPTPVVKISFSFIPLSMLAFTCGPVYSCAGAAIADFIGAVLFPTGPYFPGYTLTAALTGLTYGLFLKNKHNHWWRIIAAVVIINIVWRLGLNSVWVSITSGKAVIAFMMTRITKTLFTIPIEIVFVRFAVKRLCPLLEKFNN